MAIDMVRMPPEMSRGFVASLDFGTSIVRLDGGGEERTRTREMPRRYWQAAKGVFTRSRIEEFGGFIQARAGSFHAFRFWDPKDCSTNPSDRAAAPSMLDQFLGYGNGVKATFDLRRVYASTPNDLAARLAPEDRMLPIHSEVDDRLAKCLGLANGTTFLAMFAFSGVEQGSFTVNMRNRTVTFVTPPAVDAIVTGGYYYDWPVRLGEDADTNFETVADSWTAQSAPNIPLECVPFEKFTPETDDPGGATSLAWNVGSPLISKSSKDAAKVWRLETGVNLLTATLENPSVYNSGGPHFILKNEGTFTILIIDELTGATVVSIATTLTAWLFVEVDGTAHNWFYVMT